MLLVSGGTRDVAAADPQYVGQLITPRDRNNVMGDRLWACDNSAFSGFDRERFEIMLDKLRGISGCKFVAAPDVVGDWKQTRRQYLDWHDTIRNAGYPVGLVLQDGLASSCQVPWNIVDAVFIGGTTEFKFTEVVRRCVWDIHDRGGWAHMGRVNSFKRLRYAFEIGCDSIDGSSMSAFPATHIPRFVQCIKRLKQQRMLV